MGRIHQMKYIRVPYALFSALVPCTPHGLLEQCHRPANGIRRTQGNCCPNQGKAITKIQVRRTLLRAIPTTAYWEFQSPKKMGRENPIWPDALEPSEQRHRLPAHGGPFGKRILEASTNTGITPGPSIDLKGPHFTISRSAARTKFPFVWGIIAIW